MLLTQGMINQKTMDMHRVDVRAKLGATEIWTIDNAVGMSALVAPVRAGMRAYGSGHPFDQNR